MVLNKHLKLDCTVCCLMANFEGCQLIEVTCCSTVLEPVATGASRPQEESEVVVYFEMEWEHLRNQMYPLCCQVWHEVMDGVHRLHLTSHSPE